jgi:aerobic C4-dicarboxylate transport protein
MIGNAVATLVISGLEKERDEAKMAFVLKRRSVGQT